MMSRTNVRRAVVATIVLCTLFVAMHRQATAQSTETPAVSQGMAAINVAAREGRHLFIFFWKTNDAQCKKMYPVFESAMKKLSDSANSIAVNVTTPHEAPLVSKYGISRMPLPLVLALAPNGAVTGCFPLNFDEDRLAQGIASLGSAACLKALQDRKLVLLCVQDQAMPTAQAAMAAAAGFKANPQYGAATVIVNINPNDISEHKLLSDLKIDPRTLQAVTVLLAPPGRPIATFVGAVTTDQIVAKLKSGSTCGPGGCGPGGCGPKK